MIRKLSARQRRDWLTLARTENVGPVAFDQLVDRFGSAAEALEAIPDLARRGGRAGGLKIPGAAEIDKELADGEAIGARLIASCEPDFPQALAALDPPPPLIWARGRPELLDPRAKGTNDLLREGAAICEGAEDVLRALDGLRGFRERERPTYSGPPVEPIPGLLRRVAELLSPTPVSRDEIVRAAQAPAPAVFAVLVELSLAGRAELLPGGMVCSV